MRVVNQNIKWAICTPFEDQSPLVIDPHVPGSAVFFEVVPRRRFHKVQRRRGVELRQFALRHLFYVGKSGTFAGFKQRLRICAGALGWLPAAFEGTWCQMASDCDVTGRRTQSSQVLVATLACCVASRPAQYPACF